MRSGSRPAWCVVATKPRAERRAHASLHRYGFIAYLPELTSQRRDRTWITRPLWPGYLFVQLDLAKPWSPIRYAPGVFQLLMIDGQPAICPQSVVEALWEGEELRRIPTTPDTLHRPGAVCEAVLGGGITVDGTVLAVRGQKATIATIMLGGLRELVVDLNRLRLRDE